MAESRPAPDPATGQICPWCSAALPPGVADCPSCGAQLIAEHDSDLPGLTTVDARAKRPEIKVRSKNRLLSWISGDYADDVTSKADALAVAPPDLAVQQEILRLQIAADLADLQAEVASMAADELVETGVRDDAGEGSTGSAESLAAVAPSDDEASVEARQETGEIAEAGAEAEESTVGQAEAAPAEPEAEAAPAGDPPEEDPAAERERLRLDLEAQIAALQAQMEAMTAEVPETPAEGPTAS